MALKTRDTTTTNRGSGDRTVSNSRREGTSRPGLRTSREASYVSPEEVTEEVTGVATRKTTEKIGPSKQISSEDKGFVVTFRVPVMGLGGKCSTPC